MAGDPDNEDDMFRVQATKEVCFMIRDLQERGFECMVEHHDIECGHPMKIAYTYHMLLQYWRTTALKFLLHQYKEAYVKALQPKPLWKLSST
jgi:hypothetical protein